MKRIFLALAVVLLIGGGGAVLSLHESYRGYQGDNFLRLEKGTGVKDMGRRLAEAGVVRYPWQFWLERALNPGAKLQAGEYLFNRSATVPEVFSKIARGDVYYLEFPVPEGSNMFDIAHALEAAGIMQAGDFLEAAGDPNLIHDLAPDAKTLEGYLFPATYRLSHWVTPATLCRQMTDQFRRQWKKIAAGKNADVHQVVTLASLVEKETGLASERPLVAGVFVNRLNIGMRLACDPTTIYAAVMDNRFRDTIHRSDLASQNPYNTYQHAGLPPGPIANPGLESIAAALNPADTKYLYFVAKPSGGGHQFSVDLAAHQKATKEYRRGSGAASKKVHKTD